MESDAVVRELDKINTSSLKCLSCELAYKSLFMGDELFPCRLFAKDFAAFIRV